MIQSILNTNQSLFRRVRIRTRGPFVMQTSQGRAKRQARGPLKDERARAQREENLSAKVITFLVILDISF
jgi:hypothetical protein